MHSKRDPRYVVFLIVTGLKSVSAGKEGRSGGTSAKSSFLASLNPSRWGRSSNAAPDRPPPPKDPISLHKPNPSLPNHKEKVRTWIKQQGTLHISVYKPNPSLPNHKEKVRTWIKQQGRFISLCTNPTLVYPTTRRRCEPGSNSKVRFISLYTNPTLVYPTTRRRCEPGSNSKVWFIVKI